NDFYYYKVIIITDRNEAFELRRLNIDGSEQFEGNNLHYFVKDMEQFRGQNVVILGGGDSAVDWSLMLESNANKVTLIHRRDQFRAHEHSLEQLKSSSIDILTPFVPTDIEGEERIEHHALQETRVEK